MNTRSLFVLSVVISACSSDDGVKADTRDTAADTAETLDTAADSADTAPDTTPETEPDVVEDTAPDTTDTDDTLDADDTLDTDDAPDTLDTQPDTEDTADTADTEDTADTDEDVPDATLCESACDCGQGERCSDGTCALGPEPVFCCSGAECPAGAACVTADEAPGLCGIATSSAYGAIVFNEVLIDGATDGDANGDGDIDPVEDEFVEIANASGASIDLSGFALRETTLPDLPRHLFQPGDTLAAGSAIVVFGGGTAPEDVPGARFVIANAEDPGIPFGLSLDNDADALELVDAAGALVAVFAWGGDADLPALGDESYTRAPELTGPFNPHSAVAPPAIFSPGRKADGSTFK